MKHNLIAQAGKVELSIQDAAKNAGIPGAEEADPEVGFGLLISGLLGMVFYIAALLVFGYLVLGAMEWVTSGGDKGKLEKARDKMTHAVLGIIVLASTIAIFSIVQQFLNVCLIDFGGSNCGSAKSYSSTPPDTTGTTWEDKNRVQNIIE